MSGDEIALAKVMSEVMQAIKYERKPINGGAGECVGCRKAVPSGHAVSEGTADRLGVKPGFYCLTCCPLCKPE